MDTGTLVYLVAISSEVARTLNTIGHVALWFAVVIYIITHIKNWAIIGNINSSHLNSNVEAACLEKERLRFKEVESYFRQLCLKALGVTLTCWLFAALCPNTENVLKAYAIIEGSKVINAENAEAAGEAIAKRFDKFLDIIDHSINGNKPEQKPTTPSP